MGATEKNYISACTSLPFIGQSSLDLVEEYFTRQPQCTTMHQKKTRLSFSQLSTRDTHEWKKK